MEVELKRRFVVNFGNLYTQSLLKKYYQLRVLSHPIGTLLKCSLFPAEQHSPSDST